MAASTAFICLGGINQLIKRSTKKKIGLFVKPHHENLPGQCNLSSQSDASYVRSIHKEMMKSYSCKETKYMLKKKNINKIV